MTDTAGIKPDIRASDAERDAAVAQLGTHFQDGRLDRAELDQRIEAAITAKTRRDLDLLLTDLPATSEPAPVQAARDRAGWRAAQWPLLPLVPVLALVIAVSAAAPGWQHHGHWAPFGFLWIIGPALVVRFWVLRGLASRRRQWR